MEPDLLRDVAIIQRIDAVPSILDVVCRTTGMGFAAVARVTDGKWIACSVKDEINFGLSAGGELSVKTTICNDIRETRQPVIIDNVAEDQEFYSHPTPAMYGFKSYISIPIILSDGSFFGTLCAIDPQPRHVKTPEVIKMFGLFAELIGFHIDAAGKLEASEEKLCVSQAKLGVSEAALLDERATSELREQFIAVLGHDLRNPLSAISGAAVLIAKTPLNERATKLVAAMQSSVLRMAGLIDNVLDFARGRLGSGLTLSRDLDTWLVPTLRQAVSELRIIAPERVIDATYEIDAPVDCDRARISQLFSNLLGNALTHGATTTPIRVQASTASGAFMLSVANTGQPIPPAALERLFQPFYRGAVRASQQGLGLGLFIASEIARAHHGQLAVTSNERETRFTLTMPLRQTVRDDLEIAS